MLLAAWMYRGFIFTSIKNEFKSRFARSKIGGVWMVLNPLLQVLMYALVLSAVLSVKLPGIDDQFAYSIYLTAGFLAWGLFSEIVLKCLTIFIDNGNLMKKMVFPKICLPLIIVGSVLVNNVLLLVAIIAIFALLGHYPGFSALWLPVLFVVPIVFGLGLGLIIGVLNVFLRDVGQVVPVMLQFGFWFTPIIYTPNIIPEAYRDWLVFNPMYHVTSAFQNILVFGKAPEWFELGIVTLISVALLALAFFIFRRASAEMVDVL